MELFSLLIKICWLIFIVVWVILSFKTKKNIYSDNERRSSFIRLAIILVVISAVKRIFPQLDNANIFPFNYIVQAGGVMICAAGIVFAIWARVHIGKNWGMPMSVKEEPELVTTDLIDSFVILFTLVYVLL